MPLIGLFVTAGIGLGLALDPRPGPTLVVGAVTLAAGVLLLRRRVALFLAGLAAAATGAGVSLASVALHPGRPACHVAHRADGRTVWRLTARVSIAGVHTLSGVRVLLRAESALTPAPVGLCGGLELHVPPPGPALVEGDRVMLRGRLRPAVGSRNPGTWSSVLRYLSGDVGATTYVDPVGLVVLDRSRPSVVHRLRARVRQALARAVPPKDQRQILGALILGERGAVGPELRQDFAGAGVSHLLAVSGLHLTLVAGGVLWIVRRLLLRLSWLARRTDVRRVAAPFAILAALLYTALTGAAPSTTRACVMACACLAGLSLSRPPDLARPLCLAALVLLVRDPLDLLRPGFQLSFLAVLGIALLAARTADRPRSGALAAIRAIVLTSLVATAITAPVVALHFHRVSLVGVVANLAAIPLTTFLLLPLSLAGATLGLLHPCLGDPLLTAAGWVAAKLHALCALVTAPDHSVLGWSPGPLVAAAATLVVVGLLLRGRTARRLVLGLALALAATRGATRLWREVAPRVELTFLDVGQGDSAFVRFPGGATLLVDAGGTRSGAWDPGVARVVPFLEAQGIRRLDLVVASHPHPDHVGGLRSVLEAVTVDELWTCWHGEPSPWLGPLLEAARRRGVKVTRPYPRRLGPAVLRPLWPRAGGRCADPAYSANDNSIVLRLELGKSAALLAGDIEAAAEEDLVRAGGAVLKADLIKVPHHGSNTSSTPALLDAVRPRLAVISCGAGNAYGFPAPAVLERYRERGAAVARTDRSGAIRVELGPGGELSWRRLTLGREWVSPRRGRPRADP